MNIKLILDVPADKWGRAMNSASRIMRDYPRQQIGTSYGIKDGTDFVVIRNQGSYTVKMQ